MSFMIYEHVFDGASVLVTETLLNEEHVDPSCMSQITNILPVGRQCYAEALPMFYKHAIFTMRNVRSHGVHSSFVEPTFSSWTGRTTSRIRNLFITQSSPRARPEQVVLCGPASWPVLSIA